MLKMKRLQCLILVVAIIASSMFFSTTSVYAATVSSYSLPSIYSPSTAYSLKVGGVNIPVVNYVGEYDYAELSMSGGVATVEVTALGASSISSYSISPKKLGLTGTASGGKLTFTISKDEYLIVQINSLKKLIIAVDPEETDKPASSGAGIFNVKTDYSADSTGATKTSDAVQAAIDAASAYGQANGTQGIVYVPAGVYRVGNLVLKSSVRLYLEGGAVLRATDNPDDYIDHWYKTSQGRWVTWFIYTEENADNIKIYGRGTIDANGYYLANQATPRKLGTNLLVPVNCSNFSVDGITFRDAGSWGIITARSHDLTFTNMKIFNHFNTGEDDGIDVCESQNVLVQNAIAVALDDPFSTKSWTSKEWTEPTNISLNWHGEPQAVRNVTFDDCIAWTYCYGFKVGQGVRQVHEDVTFKNSVVYDSSAGIGMEHKYGKAEVKNITFENIDIEGVNNTNGQISTWCAFEINDGLKEGGGPVSNVKIKNITVRSKGKNDGRIKGLSESSSINGFTLENIYMLGNSQPAATLEAMNITHVAYAKGITVLPYQATSKIEAEYYNEKAGITVGTTSDVGGGSFIKGAVGAWLAYHNVDFGSGVSSIDLRLKPTKAGSIELRLDSLTGPLVGTASWAAGGSSYTTMNVPVSQASGVHTLYLLMQRTAGDTETIADVNWFDLRYTKAEAENFNGMSGVVVQDLSTAKEGQAIADCNDGDWVVYNNVDFGSGTGTSSMNLRIASQENNGSIELRLGSPAGTLIGTANVVSTGSWQNWITRNVPLTGATGVQNLYLVFKKPDAMPVANVDQISFIKNTSGNEFKIPTALTLDRASVILDLGQTIALNATVTPVDTSYNDIQWTVASESTSNVVSVSSNGYVTALKPGTAVVRATSFTNPSVYTECSITVSNTPVTIVSTEPVNVTTITGVGPVLPSSVKAVASNGLPSICSVVWEGIDPAKYAQIGSFTVLGQVTGTTFTATANVTVTYAPVPAPSTENTIKYEANANDVPVTTSSSGVVFAQGNSGVDADSSNGLGYAKFLAPGDWVEFTLNIPEAGTYNVNLWIKKHAGKGIGQLYIDGVAQGALIDEYYNGNLFTGVDLGNVAFTSAGDKKFRLVSTGKNPLNTAAASSLPYTMTVDYIKLTPVSAMILDKTKATLDKGESVNPQVIFSNIDTNSRNLNWSVLSESAPDVVSVSSTGNITALNPGTAVVRASSMVYDLHADFNVTVKTPVITSIEGVDVKTKVGSEPVLPTVVNVVYSDNTKVERAVVWNSIDPAQYAREGTFTVLGTVEGTAIPAVANIIVGLPAITSIELVERATEVGKEPSLPTVVTAVYDDGSKAERAVLWNSIDPAQYAQVGTFTVAGTVYGTSVLATAKVTVNPVIPTIISIETVKKTTKAGSAPELPTVVNAVYDNGSKVEVGVIWDGIDPAKYAQAGSFTVSGTVAGTLIPAIAEITVEPQTTGGGGGYVPPIEEPGKTVKVDVKEEDLQTAMENAKDNTVKIDAQPAKGADEVIVNIPAQQLLTLGEKQIRKVEIDTGIATVTVPAEVLKEAIQTGSTNLKLSVAKADTTGLAEEVKLAVGNNPVYNFTLSVDGNKISSFGDHAVNVEVSYTLKAGETPNKVVVYHITDSGKLEIITNGRYNAATGKVVFSLKHFSKYAAGYADVFFKDIGSVEWAKESIEALAARKVVDGIGDNAFDPDSKVTRAQFIKLLMKALELAEETAQCSLSDVKPGEWYFNSIAAAQKLGIVVGKEDGTFGVDDEISRQDMAVMVYRAAKLLQLELGNQTTNTTEFIDKSEIAGYAVEQVAAMQKAGIIIGDNGRFMPRDNATRAEAAVIIYRVFGFVN